MAGRGLWLAAGLALGGCNMVMTDRPMFARSDAGSTPPIRAGVWRNDKPDCAVDETRPQDQWPKCAGASPGVGDPPMWMAVSGEPDLLQTALPIPRGAGTKTYYLYQAYRPLKLDPQGRVIAMKEWPVRCGPPPPPDPRLADLDASPAGAPSTAYTPSLKPDLVIGLAPSHPPIGGPDLYSPTDPSSVTRLVPPSAAQPEETAPEPDDAQGAKLKADLAKLAVDAKNLALAMSKLSPTKTPLPGLTMNEMGGCDAASPAAIRDAAKASEAWADTPGTSHWVRERKAGDKPPASPKELMTLRPQG